MANKATNIHHTAISTMLGYRKCPYSTCKEKRSDAEVHGKGQHLGHEGHPPFLSEAEARRSTTDRITGTQEHIDQHQMHKKSQQQSTFKNPDGTGNAIGEKAGATPRAKRERPQPKEA